MSFMARGRLPQYLWKKSSRPDLPALQNRYHEEIASSFEYYNQFKNMGLEYGEALQGMDKLYCGEDGELAKLAIPTCVSDTLDQYVLHPSILDSALQAAIGLRTGEVNRILTSNPVIPFALEKIEIYEKCTSQMWAHIQYSNKKDKNKLLKIDVALYDSDGKLCIVMEGLVSKELKEISEQEEGARSFLLEPFFKKCLSEPKKGKKKHERRIIFYCDRNKEELEFEREEPGLERISLLSEADDSAERFQEYALIVYKVIRGVMKGKTRGDTLIQIIGKKSALFSGLLGLLQTANLENPNILGQVVELEVWESKDAVEAIRKPKARILK